MTPPIKPKQLSATVTISFTTPADSQAYGMYDPSEMAWVLKEQLEGDELEEILANQIADDTAIITVEVEVTDPNVKNVEEG
jgi:hypothetical protein